MSRGVWARLEIWGGKIWGSPLVLRKSLSLKIGLEALGCLGLVPLRLV